MQKCELTSKSISSVVRKDDIAPNMLFRSHKLICEGGLSAISSNKRVISALEVKRLGGRIHELERLLGKNTIEVETLKEAIEIAREKN